MTSPFEFDYLDLFFCVVIGAFLMALFMALFLSSIQLEPVINPDDSYQINVTEIDIYSDNTVYLHLDDSTICTDTTGLIKKPGIYTVKLSKDYKGKKVESVLVKSLSQEAKQHD